MAGIGLAVRVGIAELLSPSAGEWPAWNHDPLSWAGWGGGFPVGGGEGPLTCWLVLRPYTARVSLEYEECEVELETLATSSRWSSRRVCAAR